MVQSGAVRCSVLQCVAVQCVVHVCVCLFVSIGFFLKYMFYRSCVRDCVRAPFLSCVPWLISSVLLCAGSKFGHSEIIRRVCAPCLRHTEV